MENFIQRSFLQKGELNFLDINQQAAKIDGIGKSDFG